MFGEIKGTIVSIKTKRMFISPGLAIYRQVYFFKVPLGQVVFILDFVSWAKPWHNSKK